MKQDNSKQRLIEVMQRVDPSFKPKLNEDIDDETISIEENISIDVKVGDTIMTGRFKNKRTEVKSIDKDEHGMPTINGKKVVTFRKAVNENIHNTPQMGGILNSKGTAGYDPDASNKTYQDNLRYNNSRNPNIQGTTVKEPIIPDAIAAIQSNPDAKQFTDKQNYDEFANQQRYFSASHSHCFYSPEERQEWSKNGGKYTDQDSEQSDILFDTGHELVQVWDNKNQRGYVVPSERNKKSVKEADAFNDAGEPNMSHSQFRDHSEPAEPDFDQDRDQPQYKTGVGDFRDIDWKTLHGIFVQNTKAFKQGQISQGITVNDLTDYDGYLTPEELQHLDDHSLVYIDGQFVVIDDDQYLDYNTFLTKAQQIWGTEAPIHNSSGNDSEAPYMRGSEPMSENNNILNNKNMKKDNNSKKMLFEMMGKIDPTYKPRLNESNNLNQDAKSQWFAQRNLAPDDWHDYEGEMGAPEVSYDEYLRDTGQPIDASLLEKGSPEDLQFALNHFQNQKFIKAEKAMGFGDDFKRTYNPEDYYYMVDVQYDIDGDPNNKNTALWGVSKDGSHVSLHAN